MSATTLRQAAALMRERAEAAVIYREVRTQHPARWLVGLEGAVWDAGAQPIAVGDTDAQAEHIASMDPVVALALADLLDAQAKFMEDGGDFSDIEGSGDANALAVARAYLGEVTA